jgi:hypothetical protein
MKAQHTILILFLLAVIGLGTAKAQHTSQQQDWQRRSAWQEMWVGHYGLMARVSNPYLSPSLDRTIQYVDMGPNVNGLKLDLAPASALLIVNGQPIWLTPNTQGVLECTVTASHLNLFSSNSIELIGWDQNGVELSRFELSGGHFF